MPLSSFEQDTLEIGVGHSGSNPAQYERQVRIPGTRAESRELSKLEEAGLIRIHSISPAGAPGECAVLFSLTGKGDSVMRANWKAAKTVEHTNPQ